MRRHSLRSWLSGLLSASGGKHGSVRTRLEWLLPRTVRSREILLLLVILVPLLLLQASVYRRQLETHKEQELQTNLAVARAVATAFDGFVRDVLHQELAIGLVFASPAGLPPDEATHLLVASVQEYPSVRQYGWADPSGRILVCSQADAVGADLSPRGYFQEILAGSDWTVSDLTQGRYSGEAMFFIARAMRDSQGRLQGVVVALVDPVALGHALGFQRRGGGDIEIIDRQGRSAYRYPEVQRTWEQRGAAGSRPVVARALAGHEAAETVRLGTDVNTARMIGVAPIPSLSWAASASRPVSEAMAPVLSDLQRDVYLFLAVVVVSLLLTTAISRSVTVPVRRLRNAALALGRGETDRRAEPGGPQEVRELASAFNVMAEEIRRREEALLFITRASSVLAASLDHQATLSSLAQLCVPTLGDCCLIFLAADGTTRRVAFAHADPEQEERLRDLGQGCPAEWDTPPLLAEVLKTGRPLLIPEVDEARRLAGCGGDKGDLVRVLAAGSVVGAPLVARGSILGAIVVVRTGSGRRYGLRDLALLEELARHAALAVDNARLYGQAQEAVHKRDEFLSVAAHELRTPITSLRGFAQLVVRDMDRPPGVNPVLARRAFQVIDQQSTKLSHLVTQLLDVSRLQSGRLAIDRQLCDVARMVAGLVAAAQAATNRHQLTARTPPTAPALVDALRLEQVLANLVDNAVKYSPDGGEIEVEVSLSTADRVDLSVRDHGIGIPPEHRERVFDRFYRAHNDARFGGLGLGLYISRQIVEMHGGEMQVESPPEGGTRFLVRLPRGLEVIPSEPQVTGSTGSDAPRVDVDA